MEIRNYRPEDEDQLITLIGEYRVFLSSLKSISKSHDFDAARRELEDYLSPRYSIFVAVVNEVILGYLVCRIDQNVVWAESLFVKPSARRKGIGSALYSQAERLVKNPDEETVYNWIHPNNTVIIHFLKKRGYNVLNLVEIRKPRSEEGNLSEIQVGDHWFKY